MLLGDMMYCTGLTGHYVTILTANLVDILQGQTQRLVSGATGGQDGVQGLQQGNTIGTALFTVNLPTFEPGHLKCRNQTQKTGHRKGGKR